MMKTDPKHWLSLIVTKPRKEIRRNTKYYNAKQQAEKDTSYPVHGGFTEYGNLVAGRLGIS